MQKQLEQYFGCKVKIAEYKNKLQLPIFMTMRDIMMVEIYDVNFAIIDVVKEMELSVAAMKKQKAKYEEALQCPAAYEVALNSVSMRNALVKSGVPFVDLPGNVFLPFMGIVLQDVYLKQRVKGCRRRYRKAYATKGKGKRRNLIRKSEVFLFLFPTLFPTCYNYSGWE